MLNLNDVILRVKLITMLLAKRRFINTTRNYNKTSVSRVCSFNRFYLWYSITKHFNWTIYYVVINGNTAYVKQDDKWEPLCRVIIFPARVRVKRTEIKEKYNLKKKKKTQVQEKLRKITFQSLAVFTQTFRYNLRNKTIDQMNYRVPKIKYHHYYLKHTSVMTRSYRSLDLFIMSCNSLCAINSQIESPATCIRCFTFMRPKLVTFLLCMLFTTAGKVPSKEIWL